MSATAAAARPRSRPPITIPLPPVGLTVGAFLAAAAIGALFVYDVRFGVVALLGLLYIPLTLINLPLGAALWAPFAYISTLPRVNLVAIALIILLSVAWLGVLPARRALVMSLVRRNASIVWGLALLTCWLAASAAWAASPSAAFADVWNWIFSVVVFVLLATTITRPKHLVILILSMIAGMCLTAAAGYAPSNSQAVTAQVDGRLSGGLGDPNYLAAGIVPMIALAIGLAMNTRQPRLRWALFGAIGFLGVSLLLTGSRGGVVAAIAAVLATIAFSRTQRVRLTVVVASALVFAGLWFVSNSSGTWDRIREFDTEGTGRVELWTVAWRMAEDHPVVGVGVNNFINESVNYTRVPGQLEDVNLITEQPHVVHNIYLQQLAETGVIGLTLFLFLLGAVLRSTWLAIRELDRKGSSSLAGLGRAILVAQIAALTASTFISNGYDRVLWILLVLGPILGTIAARSRPSPGQTA